MIKAIDLATFGGRLTACRKAMGYTQAQLAELLYMKDKTISSYENNNNRPSSDVIIELCKVLDTTPNYLLGGAEDEDPWMEQMMQAASRIKNEKLKATALKQLMNLVELDEALG